MSALKRFVTNAFLLAFTVTLLLAAAACSSDPKVRRQKFLDNGNKLNAKGEYKQAALYYRRALREDQTFAEAHYRLGLTSISLGNWADAISSLQRAFSLDPSNVDAGAKLAEIYMLATAQDPKRTKQFALEIRDVSDRLLKRDPNSFDGTRLAAFLDLSEGKLTDAIAKYEKANRVKPNQQEVIMPWIQALINNKQEAEAEKLAFAQLEKTPSHGPLYDLLYVMLARSNRMEEAERIVLRKVANLKIPETNLQLAAHYYGQQKRQLMEEALAKVSGNPNVPQSYAKTGDFYFALHENAKARQEYEKGIASGKDKDLYTKRIVQVDVSEGKNENAAILVDKLLASSPKDDEAKAMKAALEVNSGDITKINKAITDLTAMVRANAENPLLHYELARSLMAKAAKESNRLDVIEQARVELEEAIKLRADFTLAKLLLSQVHINRRDYSRAVQVCDEILAGQPANMQAQLMRGVAWRELKEYDKAGLTFSNILKANPGVTDARFHLAETYFQMNRLAEAEAGFQEMRRVAEGDSRWLAGLVKTMLARQRYKEATALLHEQIAKYPENEGFKVSLASVLIKDKQFEQAEQIYQNLLKKNPNSGDLHAMLGELHQQIWENNKAAGFGELKIATDYYRKAAKITPENPGVLVKLAMALEELELTQEAKPIYETILRIEPLNPIMLNNYAYLKAEEGVDLDGALTLAQKAKQQAPNAAEVADTLGWIYIKKNLPDEALRVYRDLVKREPNNSIFRMHLAQAMFQKGDRLGAKEELQKALKTNPSKGTENQIRALLAKY